MKPERLHIFETHRPREVLSLDKLPSCRRVDNVLSPLTAAELYNAKIIAVRKSQMDFEALKSKKRLPVKSRVRALSRCVDEIDSILPCVLSVQL